MATSASTMKKKIPGAILIMTHEGSRILTVKVQPMLWNPADKDILGGPIQNPIYDFPEPYDYDLLTRLGRSNSIEETFSLLKRLKILD